MGRATLRDLASTSDFEKRSSSVEGGPLIVCDELASALIYASLFMGISCSALV